jgi:acyl carrier protein
MIETLTQEEMTKIQDIVMDQLHVTRDQVTPEAKLDADLGADSLDIVEIGMKLEEEFSFTIADEKMERLETVDDLCQAVNALLGRARG